MKYWKVSITLFSILFLSLLPSASGLATTWTPYLHYYVFYTAPSAIYGIKAFIGVPSYKPFNPTSTGFQDLSHTFVAHQSHSVTTRGSSWSQAGWLYDPNDANAIPCEYEEYKTPSLPNQIFNCYRYINWGANHLYEVYARTSDNTWCMRLNGYFLDCHNTNPIPTSPVSAQSEVHVDPLVEINTSYTDLQIQTSISSWQSAAINDNTMATKIGNSNANFPYYYTPAYSTGNFTARRHTTQDRFIPFLGKCPAGSCYSNP